MLIYVLPVDQEFQPLSPEHPKPYPPHNKTWYGVEQDFGNYLKQHPELVVSDPEAADWHYLPIYWTRYNVMRQYKHTDRAPLQREADKRILDPPRTFTICTWGSGPFAHMPEVTQCVPCHQGQNIIDIPLLCDLHALPSFPLPKKWLASFCGKLEHHPIRREMAKVFGPNPSFDIQAKNRGTKFFVDQMCRSYVALCPRGTDLTSFRFYEAMQLGTVPLLLQEVDNRPFKKWVDWDQISLYAATAQEARDLVKQTNTFRLMKMGKRASEVYQTVLARGRWCEYLLKELEEISR